MCVNDVTRSERGEGVEYAWTNRCRIGHATLLGAVPCRQPVHSYSLFLRHAAATIPCGRDDCHVVLAREAARELMDDRFQAAEMRRIVMRGDAYAHSTRVPGRVVPGGSVVRQMNG